MSAVWPPRPALPHRAATQHDFASIDALVALAALAGLLLWDLSGLDLSVVRWFGDAQGFRWRDHWLTSGLLHEGGRALGWLVLGLGVVGVFKPLGIGSSRAARAGWLGVTLACLLLVPAIKRFSATSCPWELAEFGGAAHYVSHWAFGAVDGGPGHCFPSGHATAAFAFFGGFFMLRTHHPVAARRWLAAVLAVGLLFGWAQLARGAHYPSHSLWTAWLCWVLCAAAARRA